MKSIRSSAICYGCGRKVRTYVAGVFGEHYSDHKDMTGIRCQQSKQTVKKSQPWGLSGYVRILPK